MLVKAPTRECITSSLFPLLLCHFWSTSISESLPSGLSLSCSNFWKSCSGRPSFSPSSFQCACGTDCVITDSCFADRTGSDWRGITGGGLGHFLSTKILNKIKHYTIIINKINATMNVNYRCACKVKVMYSNLHSLIAYVNGGATNCNQNRKFCMVFLLPFESSFIAIAFRPQETNAPAS